MNWREKSGAINCGNCFMISHTVSEAKNHNYIYYTKKGIKIFPTYLEYKILDYSMVMKLILFNLNPHFINIPIWNETMIIITP